MKRFVIGTAALVLGLAVAATAQAGSKGGPGGGMGGRSMGSGSGNGHSNQGHSNHNMGGNNNGNNNNNFRSLDIKGNQFKNNQFKGGSNAQKNFVQSNMRSLKATNTSKTYNKQFGFQKNGYSCYKGKCGSHSHWTHCCNWGGSQCYWCPSSTCWYYYCQPDDCCYPVEYCPYGTYSWDEE